MWYLTTVAASSCVLTAVCCSNPVSPEAHVAAGKWGGEHVALDVATDGGSIEYDCAHGRLGMPLVVDPNGRFDVTGTHTREHGGPVRDDETLEARPARYVGRVDGARMTLTVTLTDTSETIGAFTLTWGVAGRLMKCL